MSLVYTRGGRPHREKDFMNLIVHVGKGIVKLRSAYSSATMCKELKTNVLHLLPQTFNGPSAEHDSRPGQVFT